VTGRVKIGLSLPSFVEDPATPLALARTAEASGIDGVFVYDHLFRRSKDGARRPALEGVALLGAVAAATSTITVGALVMRAWLRPAESSAAAIATAARIAPGRITTALGAGDSQSREENETFGLGFGTLSDRVARLSAAVRTGRDRGARVWVGGTIPQVRDVAATWADGWNAWGIGVEKFASWVAGLRAVAAHEPFECSWGGLVVVDVDDERAAEKAQRLGAGAGTIVGGPATVAAALRSYASAGADWVIVAPVDSSDPENAVRFGTDVRELLDS
jgi:alkanesulfonate monooxygenase SsuD/methylene tetrahydromethanopterin reductase-like flavin-dependent oxidoreductase (luciferase family)